MPLEGLSRTHMFDEFGINAGYVEELHTRWLQSPQSIEEGWRQFFEDIDAASRTGIPTSAPPAANGNGWSSAAATGNGSLHDVTRRLAGATPTAAAESPPETSIPAS